MRMAQSEDMVSAVPTEGERLALPQANGACKSLLGVFSTPEPFLRLQRTQNVWQVPDLDVLHARAFLERWPLGSFLVTGHNPSQVLVLKTGPSPGEVNTYQIQKSPGGVSLESSNLCMPDLTHLLAFLSASRDILPRTLLLTSPTLGPRDKHTDPLQAGHVQYDTPKRVLSVVNQLYLKTHGGWEIKPTPEETEPETDQKYSLAPRKSAPHRVSWVEGPLIPEEPHPRPEVYHLGPEVHHPEAETHHTRPALSSLVEEKEEEVDCDLYRDEEEDPEDVLTAHVRALARARSSYVAKQYRGLRARLASDSGGPHRPGDPATELLQDLRHLLTDLQDHLAKDPEVKALFGSREPAVSQKDEDLGNGDLMGTPHGFRGAITGPTRVHIQFLRSHWHAHSLLNTASPNIVAAGLLHPPCLHLWVARSWGPGPAVEAAVCRAVLAPLKPALWMKLRTLRAPELRRLRRRQIALRVGAGPPGAQGAGPEGQSPAPALRSRIHMRLEHLHAACAPRRKVALLLAVCGDVYAGLAGGENEEPLGADAFLPALTEELIWSPHIGETQLDVEFLMELLDPEELQGEAGYYLTTWFGALYHIAHYQPDSGRAPQGLSSEARDSLRQWHRRRTLHQQSQPRAQVELPFEEPRAGSAGDQ